MNATRTTLSDVLWRWQRGIARALLLTGALAGMTLSTVAHAQITFRAASSAGVASTLSPQFRAAASAGIPASTTIAFRAAASAAVNSGVLTLTIPIPTGTVQGDVMITSIAIRPNTATITLLAGWTLVRRTNNALATASSLAVYQKVAGAAEPASYAWTLGGAPTGAAGGIQTFIGVDTTTPIDVENGAATGAATTTPATPSVTTTVANTMLVTSHSIPNRDLWANPPTWGGTQGFQVRAGVAPIMAQGSWALQAAIGATLTKTATDLGPDAADNGNAHILALRPAGLRINIPAGTVLNDVMIASIGFRPNTVTITPPTGWTLVRRMDNSNATANSLAVYRLVAGASEPASYAWTFPAVASTGAAGGIQSFSGVDTTTPIDVENGAPTAVATATPATPSVTSTVANTMLITSHSIANGDAWANPPTWGGTQGFQVIGGAEMTQGSFALQAAAGATGTKSATDLGPQAAENGNAHILALRPVICCLTINKPTGTVQNDVMIASIGFRPNTVTITPPAGWTLVRRMDNAGPTANSLAVYQKVAGASEPASYGWGITTSTGAAGGIQSFSGVDTTTPIDVENGQNTPSSLSHATPTGVTTTVPNTMLVTSHGIANADTWSPPPGMTEAFDVLGGNEAVEGSYVLQAAAGATGTKTATSTPGPADVGNAHILALRPVPPPPPAAGGFNAYETSTAPGAITGVIKTKIAGSTISVDMIALNVAKTAIETTFAGTVRVEVLNASDNSGALDANSCRPTWSVIQTLSPDPAFIAGDNGRKTISFTQANSYPNARLRITFPAGAPTVTGCSTDNFAIRPNTFASFAVSDDDWQTAGIGRTLDDVTFTVPPPGGAGKVHKAGRLLSVRATAVNAAGTPATTGNYTGAPTAFISVCGGGTAPCTATFGALTLTTTFAAGQLISDVASYNNVGSFGLQLVDSAFASVDNADSTPLEREITSGAAINVGRFVPDHFAVSLNTPEFLPGCGPFTYIGQKFNYTTAPVITVTAQGFANNTTTLYNTIGSWFRITNASLTGKAYTWAPGTAALDTTGLPGTDPVIASSGAGVGTLTFGSGTGLFFTRTTPTAPASPYDADISLAIDVIDADGVAYATNPARFGTATAGNGIAFSDGNALTTNDKQMRFGRLRMQNASGSEKIDLVIPLQAQYWTGTGFATNTADTCTSLSAANLSFSAYTGGITAGNMNAANISLGGAFALGAGNLKLIKPTTPVPTTPGSTTLTINLAAESKTYLQGNWGVATYTANPSARASFGLYGAQPRNFIFLRENY